MKVVHLALIICVFSMLYVIVVQGSTIVEQQTLIREMAKNPSCMVPKEAQ